MALTAKLIKGAEEAENSVTEFILDSMNINGCKGCFGGDKNPDSPCVQKDDMKLSILVDTFYTRILVTMQHVPCSHNTSVF